MLKAFASIGVDSTEPSTALLPLTPPHASGLTFATVAPHVWSYQHCLEVDSQYFWAGAPWDMVGRSYAAQVMNQGLGTTLYNQANVLAVSAMEGIGLSSK